MAAYIWSDGDNGNQFIFGDGTLPQGNKPIITLLGLSTIIIDKNTTFLDPGAKISDADDIIYSSDSVNTATLGTTILSYRYRDNFGNSADTVYRTVVVRDPNAFSITNKLFSDSLSLKFIDILITDDDIAVNEHAVPHGVTGSISIAQDVKHMIRESGLLVEMIGERNIERLEDKVLQIILLVELDTRLIPGTVKLTEVKSGTDNHWFLTANTYEFGSIGASFNV